MRWSEVGKSSLSKGGLAWPTFDTTVSGWSIDKILERIRVLGISPETDQGLIRKVLGLYF